jgi:protein-tyrosine phosphatase
LICVTYVSAPVVCRTPHRFRCLSTTVVANYEMARQQWLPVQAVRAFFLKKNHPNTGQQQSQINRKEFDKKRQEHWEQQSNTPQQPN